jgi:hypothetical protein
MLLTWIDDHSLQKTQMKNRMNICHVDLRHAQTTNKTKTIKDYLGGSSVQKSTCSRQLGSSLHLWLMS